MESAPKISPDGLVVWLAFGVKGSFVATGPPLGRLIGNGAPGGGGGGGGAYLRPRPPYQPCTASHSDGSPLFDHVQQPDPRVEAPGAANLSRSARHSASEPDRSFRPVFAC